MALLECYAFEGKDAKSRTVTQVVGRTLPFTELPYCTREEILLWTIIQECGNCFHATLATAD